MVADVRVVGAERFAQVARELKAAGDKGLRRELFKGLNRATKPLKAAAKQSARSTLPSRGGLAARVAGASFRTKSRAAKNPFVRIVATDSSGRSANLLALDAGRNRHPVHGNRAVWVQQAVTPGWFTRPMTEGAELARTEIAAAVDAVAAQLTR